MNLNSNFVFRGRFVSIYMSADGIGDMLLDNNTGEPLCLGDRETIQALYDKMESEGKDNG